MTRHRHAALFGLTALLCGFMLLGTAIGASFLPLSQVVTALLGLSDGFEAVIVRTLRLPRVGVAVLGGAALALSGAILQRIVRNPLAAPSVLGVSDGAALGVVAFLWIFADASNNLTVSIHWLPLASITGAAGLMACVVLVTLWDPHKSPLRVILYGVAFAALAKAITVLLMILGPVYRAGQAMTWLTGSIGAAHWGDVAFLAIAFGIGALCLTALLPVLRQMVLDPEMATASGLRLGVFQSGCFALAIGLSAAAVSQMGTIGFVGLIAPHVARRLVPELSGSFWLATVLIGSSLVLGADTLARVIAPPLEIPAGAITALLGAPLFLVLLLRERKYHV